MVTWLYRDSYGSATDLIPLFYSVLEHCNVRSDERLMIYADHHSPAHYGAAFLAAAQQHGADVFQVTIPTQQPDILEGPIWDIWHSVDMVIDLESIMTSVYRPLRMSAIASGTRVLRVTEPEDVLFRMPPDLVVRERAKKAEALVDAADNFHITSPHGTDITVNVAGRQPHGLWGIPEKPGTWDHWPVGLVVVGGNMAGTNGTIVVNVGDILLSMRHYVGTPIRITVEEGKIAAIEGQLDAHLLRQWFESWNDPRAYHISHVGWGCDHRAVWNRLAQKVPGGTCDAESFFGVMQIAFGRDTSPYIGGQNDVFAHIDFDCLNNSIALDGRQIIENEKFVLPELQ